VRRDAAQFPSGFQAGFCINLGRNAQREIIMRNCLGPVEAAPLIEDLLETSAALYHKRVALIQQAFAAEWFTTLHQQIGIGQIEAPDAHPVLVEAAAREGLETVRRALRERQAELIDRENAERALRDAAIRAYVASHAGAPTHAAA
jgi:hypothetical protein